jgi:hypothetical protein
VTLVEPCQRGGWYVLLWNHARGADPHIFLALHPCLHTRERCPQWLLQVSTTQTSKLFPHYARPPRRLTCATITIFTNNTTTIVTTMIDNTTPNDVLVFVSHVLALLLGVLSLLVGIPGCIVNSISLWSYVRPSQGRLLILSTPFYKAVFEIASTDAIVSQNRRWKRIDSGCRRQLARSATHCSAVRHLEHHTPLQPCTCCGRLFVCYTPTNLGLFGWVIVSQLVVNSGCFFYRLFSGLPLRSFTAFRATV